MKIVVLYCTVVNGPITGDYSARFVSTWNEYPPGYECDLMVGCNGGVHPRTISIMFEPLKPKFFARSNEGWDIGLFLEASKGPCAGYDAMLCLGESVYFHRSGWLKRFVEAWEKYGEGMYGPFSSNAVLPHMNTTAFFTSPTLLKNYPKKVVTRQDRYGFEHQKESFWRRVEKRGLPVRMVTWDGEYEPRLWRMPKNILWRGDQSNVLMACNHFDSFANQTPEVKAMWARRADAAFR